MKIILMGLLVFAFQAHAEMQLRHGFHISGSLDNSSADVSGKHQDFAAFIGTNPEAITEENATVDGKISSAFSFGYNLRYVPEVGFGCEFGVYLSRINIPKQDAALIHDDGTAFRANTLTGPVNVVVDSPSSYIGVVNLYAGGLYNFVKIADNYTPYIGAGYARVIGNWHNSYYRGTPGDDPRYGTEGKTKVDGHYISVKAGINLSEHYNLEVEYARYNLHADSFRSFNINGADAEFSKTSLNFVYSF
ncbi:MAG: outer membrane beta-barrel protein [Methylococcales symbiont of Iophon sp. n. MRB-2018]|nr:MAG: outer membrane beta-barrel protein [Methylococcales symbiont of Iophon sp. n. MRB-2018]KAF3980759.1 MAG: outer membrane beta-barrel protein [Methylococcales symbiont of Iophon sp. n. MRB-2018]